MNYKDQELTKKDQKTEKQKQEQGTDLKELELITFLKAESQIIELI